MQRVESIRVWKPCRQALNNPFLPNLPIIRPSVRDLRDWNRWELCNLSQSQHKMSQKYRASSYILFPDGYWRWYLDYWFGVLSSWFGAGVVVWTVQHVCVQPHKVSLCPPEHPPCSGEQGRAHAPTQLPHGCAEHASAAGGWTGDDFLCKHLTGKGKPLVYTVKFCFRLHLKALQSCLLPPGAQRIPADQQQREFLFQFHTQEARGGWPAPAPTPRCWSGITAGL